MANKKWNPKEAEQELLRARFTLWLDTTLARASVKYREQMDDDIPDDVQLIPMDMLSEDMIADPHNPYEGIETGPRDFDFAEERISKALSELPLMRKEVLRLLFVEQKTPREIAAIMRCSEAFVSLQKTRAINKLRALLMEGDSTYG